MGTCLSFINISRRDRILYLLYIVVISTILFPQNIFVKFLFCLYLLPIVLRVVKFDNTAFWLFVFSLSYAVIGLLNGKFTLLFFSYLISPVTFYLFGKYVVYKAANDEFILSFILATTFFLGLYVYIGAIKEMMDGLLITPTRNIEYGYLNGMKATLVSCIVSLGYCGLPMCFFSGKKCSLYLKLLFLLCFILSMTVMFHLTSRTGIVISSILIFAALIYSSLHNKRRIIIIIVLLSFVFFVVYLQFESFFESVLKAYDNRNEYSSVEDGGGRLFRWVDGI